MTRDELALEFVMGGLSPLERAAVARDRLSDPELHRAIQMLETTLAPLTGLAGRIEPSIDLFDRIAQAVDAEKAALAGKFSQIFDEGEWQPYLPGIEIKTLWSDKTFLMRCQPGSIVPAHPHPETEHLVIISGTLIVGGRTFRTGDWHSSPANNDHDALHSPQGCILLVHLAA